jgi:hypothetical protein
MFWKESTEGFKQKLPDTIINALLMYLTFRFS